MNKKEAPVFIDPTTDIGFKRLFGDKENLLNFLNIIFRGRKDIVDLTYRDTERTGAADDIGTVIFDLMVETRSGEEVIIEMQAGNQRNFKKRILYYASRTISDKAPKGDRGEWGYAIPEVYTVVLMGGFRLPDSDKQQVLHDICLCDRESGKIFYEGMGFIYIELINFEKGESELDTDLDKLFYMIKNMPKLLDLPRMLNSKVFQRFFQLAKYAKLTKEEQRMYDISLKRKWDAEAVRLYQEDEREEVRVLRVEIEADKKVIEEDKKVIEEDKKVIEENKKVIEENKKLIEADKKVVEEDKKVIEENKKKIEEMMKKTTLVLQEAESKVHIEKLQIAREMKKDGFPMEKIVHFTKLPIEAIENV